MRRSWVAVLGFGLALGLSAAWGNPPPPEEDYGPYERPPAEAPSPSSPAAPEQDAPQPTPRTAARDPADPRPGTSERERAEALAAEGGQGGQRQVGRTRVRRPSPDLTNQIRTLGETPGTAPPEDAPASTTQPCTYQRTGGWMQPVQTVYQDDDRYDFVSFEEFGRQPSQNPQLRQLASGGLSAQLPMISGKPTVVTGVARYRKLDGSVVELGARDTIRITYDTNCTVNVPVRLRLRVTDADGERDVWTSQETFNALLEGPPKPQTTGEQVPIEAPRGLPGANDGGAFTLRGQAGAAYSIVAELIRADTGARTGLFAYVGGPLEALRPPRVRLVPVMLQPIAMNEAERTALLRFTRSLAARAAREIPDFFPLAPGALSIQPAPLLDVSALDPARLDPGRLWLPHPLDYGPDDPVGVARAVELRRALFRARVTARLSGPAFLGGADRIVAVVGGSAGGGDDFDLLRDRDTAGFILTSKVSFISARWRRSGYADPGEFVQVVAHELTHSLPDFVFSGTRDERHNMVQACGRNYHNEATGWATGLRLTLQGLLLRDRTVFERRPEVMGEAVGSDYWIGQCTYAHLIQALRRRPDPELFLVRAIVSRAGPRPIAHLEPGYQLMGEADLAEDGPGDWAIRLTDPRGRVLATYPFAPPWQAEEDLVSEIAPVVARVPVIAGAGRVEIVHAGAVVGAQRIPAAPPVLTVDSPEVDRGGRSVRLTWRARGEGQILSSVLRSDDGGESFEEVRFEAMMSSLVVPLAPGARPLFKVVVSDGARSAEQVVRLAPPPSPQGSPAPRR